MVKRRAGRDWNDREIRDSDRARRLVTQGLCTARVRRPDAADVLEVLKWASLLAADGDALPPLGFVADLGAAALRLDEQSRRDAAATAAPTLPAGLLRRYDDYVLGKLDADSSFQRAADALCLYHGDELTTAVVFLIRRVLARSRAGGVWFSPAVLKTAASERPAELLDEGWNSLELDGPDPLLLELYEDVIAAVRDTGELLGPEDVFELEHKTAVAGFSQRVALRQVLTAADRFERGTSPHPPSSRVRRREVATHLFEEDAYPIGGFTSISTRGSIESLLHSQLAFMEDASPKGGDEADRPDLFDVKFLRDELLYYSRDENEFLRQRRRWLIALYPELVEARVKDVDLPRQRIVLLLGLLVAAVRKLIEWLGEDDLRFDFAIVEFETEPIDKPDAGSGRLTFQLPSTEARRPLADERELLEMLFREQIANETVVVRDVPVGEVQAVADELGRRSRCHLVTIGTGRLDVLCDNAFVEQLIVNGPRPRFVAGDEVVAPGADDAVDAWDEVLAGLLSAWV